MSMSNLGGILQQDGRTPEANEDPPSDRKGAAVRRTSEAHRLVHKCLESRRRRQSLKRSGDYLGVQGINPETGEFDVMTPTDSTPRSSMSAGSKGKANTLRKILHKNGGAFVKSSSKRAEEEELAQKEMEEEKFDRLQRQKEVMKTIGKSLIHSVCQIDKSQGGSLA
ncbi:hypothetical protein ESCO_003135 [Escovopsis weberi]|uniref:Uncharacterized protein n=1 Tax=Escovopsis weberi TaxID=150374 RepID=A0A0M8MT66_ESCWE|nr:hypothetical protein ESCO_003135 [Escovopsis weberi]